MEKKLKANLERGKKWKKQMELAVFEQRQKDIDWYNSQDSIVKDIKAYEENLDPVKKTKSKEEK